MLKASPPGGGAKTPRLRGLRDEATVRGGWHARTRDSECLAPPAPPPRSRKAQGPHPGHPRLVRRHEGEPGTAEDLRRVLEGLGERLGEQGERRRAGELM